MNKKLQEFMINISATCLLFLCVVILSGYSATLYGLRSDTNSFVDRQVETEMTGPVTIQVERIRYSGLSRNESIVVVLLGDAFAPQWFGAWNPSNPNPATSTLLYHANNAITRMEQTHPFKFFSHLFTVYVANVVAQGQVHGENGFFGTVREDGNFVLHDRYFSNNVIPFQIRQMAYMAIGDNSHREIDLLQVISNARDGTGFAIVREPESGLINIAVASLRRDMPVQINPWQYTFLHEFGHSLAQLADEDGRGHGERPNMTAQQNDSLVRWAHFVGYGKNLGRSPIVVAREYPYAAWGHAAPTRGNCIMNNFVHKFCAVCSAEITYRLSTIVQGTPNSGNYMFLGKRYNGFMPLHQNVVIPNGTTRILPYAFHGNANIRSVVIPASVTTIHDYAFIGSGIVSITYLTNSPPAVAMHTFTAQDRARIVVTIPVGAYWAFRFAGWTGFTLVENWGFTTSGNGSSVTLTGSTVAPVGSLNIPYRLFVDGAIRNITAIWSNAFQNQTQITGLNIPSSITTIGANAFANATGLRVISNHRSIPQPINSTVFQGVDRALITLYILPKILPAYQNAGWTGFARPHTYITNAQGLYNIRHDPYRNFTLAASINLANFNGGQWTPIPSLPRGSEFRGTHGLQTISNMTIQRAGVNLTSDLNLGLFERVYGSLETFRILNASIHVGSNHNGSAWINAGAVAGRLGSTGTISNVTVGQSSIRVYRQNSRIGGIVGESWGNFNIIDQHSESWVQMTSLRGNGDIGGAIGAVRAGNVNRIVATDPRVNSEANATIWWQQASLNRSIGGIVGMQAGGTVSSSISSRVFVWRASSAGSPNIGGVVGHRQSGSVIGSSVSNSQISYLGGLFNTRRTSNLTTIVGNGGVGPQSLSLAESYEKPMWMQLYLTSPQLFCHLLDLVCDKFRNSLYLYHWTNKLADVKINYETKDFKFDDCADIGVQFTNACRV